MCVLTHNYVCVLTLRFSSEKLSKVPKTNLKSAGNRSFHFQAAKIWNSRPANIRSSSSLSSFKKIWKHIFLKNLSLLVCKTPFLHSLTVGWMCACRGSGVNMITDVLYSVNIYILFLCKALWATSCYGHCAMEVLCIITIIIIMKKKKKTTPKKFKKGKKTR